MRRAVLHIDDGVERNPRGGVMPGVVVRMGAVAVLGVVEPL